MTGASMGDRPRFELFVYVADVDAAIESMHAAGAVRPHASACRRDLPGATAKARSRYQRARMKGSVLEPEDTPLTAAVPRRSARRGGTNASETARC
jgi:hypothetical protein